LWLFFMLLFSSILGIFLSVILLYFNVRNNKSTIYLGGFFFLVSLYELTQYVLFSSNSNFLVAVFLLTLVSWPISLGQCYIGIAGAY